MVGYSCFFKNHHYAILNYIHLIVSQKLLFCIAVFLLFKYILKKKYTQTTFNTFVIYSWTKSLDYLLKRFTFENVRNKCNLLCLTVVDTYYHLWYRHEQMSFITAKSNKKKKQIPLSTYNRSSNLHPNKYYLMA